MRDRGNFVDMTGKKYGRLQVLTESQTKLKDGHIAWDCICDCGKLKTVPGASLRYGDIVSCGCYMAEQVVKRTKTHGLTNHRLYNIWQGMKDRCLRIKSSDYPNYGARGISICAEWLADFKVFYDWAMANGYQSDLEIDRINNDSNYEPSNCRWANQVEQRANRRPTKPFIVPREVLQESARRGWITRKARIETKLSRG